jgi:tetratricopeptide (TPR) repeat protein
MITRFIIRLKLISAAALLCTFATTDSLGQGAGRPVRMPEPEKPANEERPVNDKQDVKDQKSTAKTKEKETADTTAKKTEAGTKTEERPKAEEKLIPLTVESGMDSCQVEINGKLTKILNATESTVFQLKKGKHTIQVSRNDQKETHKISLKSSKTLLACPAPKTIAMTISTGQMGASVYVDGFYKGTTDSSGQVVIDGITQGTHNIRVVREGFEEQKADVNVTASNNNFTVNLQPDVLTRQMDTLRTALAEGRLSDAFSAYESLLVNFPTQQDLPEFETMLTALKDRSKEQLSKSTLEGLNVNAKQAEEIFTLFERARRLRLNDPDLNLLSSYWRAKQLEATLPSAGQAGDKTVADLKLELTKIDQFKPNDPTMLYDMGWIYMKLRDYNSATVTFLLLHNQHTDWASPLYALAKMHIMRGDNESSRKKQKELYQLAVEHSSLAIKAAPDFVKAYAERSLAYSRLEKHKEALRDGQKATSLNPQSAYANFALGMAAALKGKKELQKLRKEMEIALSSNVDELDNLDKIRVKKLLEN